MRTLLVITTLSTLFLSACFGTGEDLSGKASPTIEATGDEALSNKIIGEWTGNWTVFISSVDFTFDFRTDQTMTFKMESGGQTIETEATYEVLNSEWIAFQYDGFDFTEFIHIIDEDDSLHVAIPHSWTGSSNEIKGTWVDANVLDFDAKTVDYDTLYVTDNTIREQDNSGYPGYEFDYEHASETEIEIISPIDTASMYYTRYEDNLITWQEGMDFYITKQ